MEIKVPIFNDLFSEKEVKEMEKILNEILEKNLIEYTNIVNKLLELKTSTAYIVKKSLKQFYSSKVYKNSISKYLINVKNFGNDRMKIYNDNGLKLEFSEVNNAQKLVINEYLDYYTENGLNSKFNQPLRELIYKSISQGISQSEMINKLNKYVQGGKDKSGKLKSYIQNVALQGADAYTSIVDQNVTDKYFDKVTGFIMTGTLIETSSPQCEFCVKDLKRTIKKENWQAVEKIAKTNGLIEGTTFKNLPTNKLHWGCRHSFTPKLT